MQIKLFEIRDVATFIPALAIRLNLNSSSRENYVEERYLLRRSGYGPDSLTVMLTKLAGGEPAHVNVHDWVGNRTMNAAHCYIEEHWDKLKSGQVICIETILGLRDEPKLSERLTS
jgi:hypothetical protein